MIKVTLEQLKQLNACEAGIIWFNKRKNKSLKSIISSLLKDNHFDYARWLLVRLLTNEQNQLWAINSAEVVLPLFESRYPTDMRPRNAIQAARDFIAGKTTRAAANAAYVAANAAADAANAAAYAAADAAADAAANAAAYVAADAAYVAANVAANAAARQKKEAEVCEYALRLLGESK